MPALPDLTRDPDAAPRTTPAQARRTHQAVAPRPRCAPPAHTHGARRVRVDTTGARGAAAAAAARADQSRGVDADGSSGAGSPPAAIRASSLPTSELRRP
ncbi:hypothetical protein ACFSM7_11545 [Clavibacter michiganensis subsp. tessellarius]|uniref:hypothetical protein n=1 Tax=Clavibacter tessellarius TaxID=31965 RepID=UPI003631FBBD